MKPRHFLDQGQEVHMTTREMKLFTVLIVLLLLLAFSGCANMDTWCDDHPVACPIVVTVGSACVAAAVGVIAIKSLHNSSSVTNSNSSPPPSNPCAGNPACSQ